MIRLVDTHCHLNLDEAFADPDAVIAASREAGVDRLIVIGIDMPTSARAVEIAERNEGVWAAVGIHPNSAAEYKPANLKVIEEWLTHPKVVALGEVGLDYYWDFATPEKQDKCLRDQLDLADAADKPVVFHCREAYPSLLKVLDERAPRRFVMHCFSGDAGQASHALRLGAFFGVDGPLTYPKALDLRHIFKALPQERVFIETDSPYLAPAPHRGKPNRPAYLSFVNAMLAAVWGVTPEQSASITSRNAEAFFGLA